MKTEERDKHLEKRMHMKEKSQYLSELADQLRSMVGFFKTSHTGALKN